MSIFHKVFFALSIVLSFSTVYAETKQSPIKHYGDREDTLRYWGKKLSPHWRDVSTAFLMKAEMIYPAYYGIFPYNTEFKNLYEQYWNWHSRIKSTYKPVLTETPQSKKDWYRSPSEFEQLFEYYSELIRFHYEWDCAFRTFFHAHKIRNSLLTDPGPHFLQHDYHKDLEKILADRNRQFSRLAKTQYAVSEIFQEMYREYHPRNTDLRFLHDYGFMRLKEGNNIAAMHLIKELIDASFKNNDTKYLSADTFVQLGIACSMSLEYGQAVDALTQALQKDPTNSDAYIERAIAYFEQGNFDLAIKDYIASGKDIAPPQDASKIEFGAGFLKGAAIAVAKGVDEFIPSLCYSLRGMSQLLWTYNNRPVKISKDLVDATIGAVEYIRTKNLSAISKDMAPELHELITKWDTFDAKTRGEKSGFVFGKYGINILASFGGTKAFKAFQELRRGNAVCNLKTLAASPYTNAPVMDAATKAVMVRRQQYFKSVKLHLDKQGKHIESHRNYKELITNKENPSIWTCHEPEKVLAECAGTGMAVGKIEAGFAGYREVITYKEYIGFYVNETGTVKLPTKRFTIHYAGDGTAHMVPAHPEKGFYK